jgi:hypothetical protein
MSTYQWRPIEIPHQRAARYATPHGKDCMRRRGIAIFIPAPVPLDTGANNYMNSESSGRSGPKYN